MKNWSKVIRKGFTDKFDLPLLEDSTDDFYTVDEIKQEVNKRIQQLTTLGADFTISPEYIVEYKIADDIEAIANVEPTANKKYRFKMSKNIARKRYEKYFDTIIYHELCHILQNEFLFDMNVLEFIDGDLYYNPEFRDEATLLYDKADGHTALWYRYVNPVNYVLMINPPVSRFLDLREDRNISDIFLEETFAKKEWLPVKRKVFTDDFSVLLKYADEEYNTET